MKDGFDLGEMVRNFVKMAPDSDLMRMVETHKERLAKLVKIDTRRLASPLAPEDRNLLWICGIVVDRMLKRSAVGRALQGQQSKS